MGHGQGRHLEIPDPERAADHVGSGLEVTPVTVFPVEDVGESRVEPLEAFLGRMDRDFLVLMHGETAQVVEAHDVIAVGVGEKDRVELADSGAQALLAEIGAGIDDQRDLGSADVEGRAKTLVFRIPRRADGAITADHGHPDRGAGAEEGDFHAGLHCMPGRSVP